MPTTKDFLVKVKDLPEFDGLKLTPDNKLRIPDATINLGETAGGVATNTLNKDHFNLGSGTTTMLIEPNTFRMIKDIPADVEQQTDAEYYKVEIDSVHQTFTIYDTDRITPIFQVTSSGLALGSSVITGITSQGGTSSTLAASQLLVNGKQNTLTAGSNIQIVNDVISAVLTEASNIIGTTDPQVGQGSPGVLYLKYEDVPSGSHVDPETGETVTDYTREIVNVYGNISGLWYEFPEGSLNLFGTTPPTADMGDNGSIYMQFNTVDGITQVYGKVNDTWYPFGGGGSVDPAIQKKVDELDETAIRTDAPLYTIDGEPLETINESQLEARGKNNIEDNVVVTQVQTSGTEIAQVKVGTHTTSIYAPSGGGGNAIILNGQIYSTEERQIGVWTDGKPLYQKTIDTGLVPNNTIKTIAHNINNIETIVNYFGIALNSSGSDAREMPYVAFNDWSISLYVNATNITMQTKQNLTDDFPRSYVTIQYTKTTDTSGSGGYQAYGFSPVIYSTTEREVGVGENNKPLYQVTLESGTLSADSDTSTGLTNIETCHVIALETIIDNREESPFYISMYDYQGGGTAYGMVALNTSTHELIYRNMSRSSSIQIRAVIQYTKTTDVAGSGSYNTFGVPTHNYSTNEQVVGTWIDGSTLYEITLDITLTSANHMEDLSSLGINKFCKYSGVIVRTSGTPGAYTLCFPYVEGSNWYQALTWDSANNNLIISSSSDMYANYKEVILTIQYTK